MLAVDFTAVPDRVACNGVFREGLDYLLPGPGRSRILRRMEVNHPLAMMGQYYENKQDPERGRGNGEEIAPDQVLDTIVQENLASPGAGLPALGHPP